MATLSRVGRNAPIAVILGYLTFTVVIFSTSPWQWPISNAATLYLFLGASHLALLIGYLTARRHSERSYKGRFTPDTLVRVSAIITLILFLPTLAFRTGSITPNLSALSDLGAAYVRSGELRRGAATPVIEYIRFFFGVPLYLTLPLTIFFWDALRRSTRLLACTAIGSTLVMFVLMGTNKALADTVLLAPCMLVAAHFAGRRRLRATRAVVWSGIAAVGFSLFLAFFTETQASRPGSASYHGYLRAADVSVDYDNFWVKGLPPDVAVGVVGLTSYIGQGYYATSLALNEPWVPTWGYGNSFFTLRQASRLFGEGVADDPYPMRIEVKGWDAYGLFSSIYPWIASDVSFPGALLVVFLIGRALAVAWRDTVLSQNPFAVGFLAHLLIMLFYFPANNQMLQSGEGFSAFWGTFIAWRLTRSRYLPAPHWRVG